MSITRVEINETNWRLVEGSSKWFRLYLQGISTPASRFHKQRLMNMLVDRFLGW